MVRHSSLDAECPHDHARPAQPVAGHSRKQVVLHLVVEGAEQQVGPPAAAYVPGSEHLRAQIVTSRNIRGDWWTDLLFGSLNYQVEHHLFPRMPRNRLRRSSVIVQAFCAEIGVPYHETSFLGSYRELLRFLHGVGAPLRSPAGAPAD